MTCLPGVQLAAKCERPPTSRVAQDEILARRYGLGEPNHQFCSVPVVAVSVPPCTTRVS